MTPDEAQQSLGAFRSAGHLSVSAFNADQWREISKLPDAHDLRLLGICDDCGSSIEIGRDLWRYDPVAGLHVDVFPLMRRHPSVGWLEFVEANGHVAVSLLLEGTEAAGDVTVKVFHGSWRGEPSGLRSEGSR
jgi:hypothetical protein